MKKIKRYLRNIRFRLQRIAAEILQQIRGDDYFICETCLAVTHYACMGSYYHDVTTCGNCAAAGENEANIEKAMTHA